MSEVVARGRAAVARADESLLALRDGLTPGQRWTAVLAMALTCLVLLYGLPHRPVLTAAAPANAAAAPSGSASAPTSASGASGASAYAPSGPAVAGATPLAGYPTAPIGSSSLPANPAHAPPAPASVPLSFVALVRVNDRPVPGRDDASIAKVFLAHGGFPVTVLPLSTPDTALCQQVVGAGSVVLAGAGLDRPLRDCLLGAGETVLSFDGLGDRPPSGASGQALSTRRGVADSMADLGPWGATSHALHGHVGLVIDESARDATAGVAAALRAAGIDVVTTAYVGDSATDTSVADGVRTFNGKGVDVAVLAAPVAVQTRWLAAAAVLAPNLHYVVADGFDAISNEAYPASFDGALSYTSLRVPWFARAHGETATQAACRQRWESTVTPAQTLSNDELVDVFAWCEDVALVAAGLANATDTVSFGNAIRAARFAVPLTSDVGPLGNGGWGPIQDATLVWHASCSCWQEKEPFGDRRSS